MGLFDRFTAKKEQMAQVTPPMMKEEPMGFYAIPGSVKYDKSLPKEYYNNRFVWFGDDNLMPNHLNEMYQSSPIHSAICDLKRDMVCGAGYTIALDSNTFADRTALRQFEIEATDESSLQQLIDDITLDYIIHSTVYLKITWNSDHTKWFSIERIEPSQGRVGTDMSKPGKVCRYYYSYDWKDTGRFSIQEIPAYDKLSKNRTEIIRFVKRTPAMKWYALPQYSAAANWIKLDASVSLFHKSSIENGTNPSKMIVFKTKPGPEAKREIINNFQKSYVGEETTGKSMIFFVDGDEQTPEVITLQPAALDKQYETTAEQALRNICHAHRCNPIIMGIKTSHSLGNPRELLNALEIFNKTVVEPTQGEIEHIVNKILLGKGIPATFSLNKFELDLKEDERATVVATAPVDKIQE